MVCSWLLCEIFALHSGLEFYIGTCITSITCINTLTIAWCQLFFSYTLSSWLRRNLPTGRVFAVRGNHENYVIANPDEYEWAKMASPEDLAFLTTFPYTISIPLHDAIVVHAGLLPDR